MKERLSDRNGLRERILRLGADSLDEVELLSLILGPGISGRSARQIALSMLEGAGGLRRFATRTGPEMLDTAGIGSSRASRLLAVFALARRLAEKRMSPGFRVRSSRDVFEHFHLRRRDAKREIFSVLLLDSKHRVIREERISEGSLTAAIVHPREVFKPAISELAGAIVAVHNHPSGDPTPSNEDFEITRRLKKVGDIVGIHLLDHVVLGDGDYVSFREHSLLEW